MGGGRVRVDVDVLRVPLAVVLLFGAAVCILIFCGLRMTTAKSSPMSRVFSSKASSRVIPWHSARAAGTPVVPPHLRDGRAFRRELHIGVYGVLVNIVNVQQRVEHGASQPSLLPLFFRVGPVCLRCRWGFRGEREDEEVRVLEPLTGLRVSPVCLRMQMGRESARTK